MDHISKKNDEEMYTMDQIFNFKSMPSGTYSLATIPFSVHGSLVSLNLEYFHCVSFCLL
jgi:hypothetical protein